jgi:hypothetical protein
MKTKIILTIALISLTISSKAQTIPNSNFESWNNIGGWYLNPENWETNNNHLMTPVQQDTNSYCGNYALTINHDYSSITGYAKSKFPLNVHPSAIKVYVKCEVSTTDKVSIQVDLYLNRQIIDDGMWSSTMSISEWTLITIPITQRSTEGDSIEIKIIGGDSLQTSFSLDEFSYDLISGIDTYPGPVWKLYPNPFHDKLKYKLPGIGDNQLNKFEIIDIYGRTVACMNSFTRQGELDLSGLTNGAYIVKIKTDNEVLTKIVIKE